jgi:hypothetical protein
MYKSGTEVKLQPKNLQEHIKFEVSKKFYFEVSSLPIKAVFLLPAVSVEQAASHLLLLLLQVLAY